MIGILLCIILTFATVHAVETQPDDIIGVWLVEEDGELVEKIEIFKCDDEYCGKIVWIKQSDSTGRVAVDSKNKKKELRTRPLLGLDVLKGYKSDGQDSWRDGEWPFWQRACFTE